MGGLIQPSPASEQPESSMRPILIGVALVVVVLGVIVLLTHRAPKGPVAPPPYAANVKLSDVKMSAAENFVGASVTYIDGTVTNAGDRSVIRVMIHVVFRNSMNQVAQAEDVSLHVLQTKGPYPDAVDLLTSPLTPGQTKPFRLTFEHVSADWNQAYPELQVSDVTTR